MRFAQHRLHVRALSSCAFAALAAVLMSGCSSDSSRLAEAFSNPFFSRGADATPTGSTTATQSGTKAALQAAPLIPQSNVAAAATPSPTIRGAALAPLAPSATSGIASGRSPGGGWVAEGGTPIVVAQGETAGILATRYGVPEAEMLRLNGFNTSAQVQPGTRLVIPAYNASGVSRPAARVAGVKAPKLAKEKHGHAAQAIAAAPGVDAKGVKLAKLKKPGKPVATPLAAGRTIPGAKAAIVEPTLTGKATAAPKAAMAATSLPATPKPAAPAKVEPIRTASLPKSSAPQPTAPLAIDKAATGSLPPAASVATQSTADGNPEFRWPARGRIIQGFQGGNDGINIAVPEGTSVKAAEGGVVAYAGSELKGYGNLVLIKHPNGFVSAYANNGSIDVKRGDQVKRGQIIAKSGQSGNVSSPQLHFELRKGSTPVDPTNYLAGL